VPLDGHSWAVGSAIARSPPGHGRPPPFPGGLPVPVSGGPKRVLHDDPDPSGRSPHLGQRQEHVRRSGPHEEDYRQRDCAGVSRQLPAGHVLRCPGHQLGGYRPEGVRTRCWSTWKSPFWTRAAKALLTKRSAGSWPHQAGKESTAPLAVAEHVSARISARRSQAKVRHHRLTA
jgi:hypothetical protein